MPPNTKKTKIAIERITMGQMLGYRGAEILTKDDRTRERPVVALRASDDLPKPRLEDQLRPVLNHAAGIERIESAETAIRYVINWHSSLRVVPEVEELHANLKL